MSTKISWTNETWNPIIGCEKISPGCKNCYASKMAYRLAHMEIANSDMAGNYRSVINARIKDWNGNTHFQESQLNKPLKWKKSRMIFVCSMGDLFHESVKYEWIQKVFDIMVSCEKHTFQILTKRPKRMELFIVWYCAMNNVSKLTSNIWLGTTIENQDQIERARILLNIPAKIHFVSVEPMLSEIDFNQYFFVDKDDNYLFRGGVPERDRTKLIHLLDWVICGGESGHHARHMHIDWVRNLKDQCKEANVPFFFKQGSQNTWENYKDYDLFPEDLKIRQMPV